jgi:23S rRNA (cytidine1920-2'-O)/16S rRNA (cytidine1409-2'-O)-methyltransferase
LDSELVRRGLAASRSEAADAIRSGIVTVGGYPASKATTLVAPDDPVAMVGASGGFVSCGGAKLEAALDRFALDVTGARALDAGASSGGFTDVLLRRGAAHVVAVDVGYGQLDWSLRDDARGTVLERTNVRDLTPEMLPYRPDLVTADLSFISLRTALPALVGVSAERVEVVLLVKPQFEVGKGGTDHGVVRDPEAHRRVLDGVTGAAAAIGLGTRAVIASPILGPEGNREFLVHLQAGPSCAEIDERIDEAVTPQRPGQEGPGQEGPRQGSPAP